MGFQRDKCVSAMTVAMCVVVTVLLYLPLSGNEWVQYLDGHSGMWHDCNTSSAKNNTTSKKNSDIDDCTFISVTEADALLHPVRALYITGFILWCLSLFYRRVTWKHRDTTSDYYFILAAFFDAAFIATATAVFSKYYWDRFVGDTSGKYSRVRYSYNFHLSIAACVAMGCVILLTLMSHETSTASYLSHYHRSCFRQLKNSRCCLCLGCCDCTKRSSSVRNSASPPSPSSSSSSSSTSSSSSASVTSSNPELNSSSHAPSGDRRRRRHSSRTTRISTIDERVSNGSDFDSRSPSYSFAVLGYRGNSNRSRIVPADPSTLVLPPSYEEVSRRNEATGVIGDERESARVDSPTGPPTYEEATGQRELILSPPPAYSESVS